MRLALLVSLLCLFPITGNAAEPARTGAAQWVIAASAAPGDDVRFIAPDGTPIPTEMSVQIATDDFVMIGKRFRIDGPATVALVTLSETTDVRAIACRTVDGLELCSAPTSDAFRLVVVTPPTPPVLIDVEAIREAAEAIKAAADKIIGALP